MTHLGWAHSLADEEVGKAGCDISVRVLWAQTPVLSVVSGTQLLCGPLCGGKSAMGVLLLILLEAACVFSVGVGLWVFCSHFFTTDIPAAISHPVRLRVLYYLFQLLVTWVSCVFSLFPHGEG